MVECGPWERLGGGSLGVPACMRGKTGEERMRYQPEVIIEMAEKLSWQAKEAQIVQTLFSLGFGLVLGLLASFLYSLVPPTYFLSEVFPPGSLVAGSTVIFGFFGFLRAREEAHELRFRAHQALCQLEIEKHLEKISRRPR